MREVMCARPDNEAECKRLTDECCRLRELKEQLKMKLSDVECNRSHMETEIFKLKAQLDIVYLIFGKD